MTPADLPTFFQGLLHRVMLEFGPGVDISVTPIAPNIIRFRVSWSDAYRVFDLTQLELEQARDPWIPIEGWLHRLSREHVEFVRRRS